MPPRKASMYELRDASVPQRVTLAAISALWLALSWWLLFGGGLHAVGGRVGWTWRPGDPVRRACLASGFSIYYIRILFTQFVFLKRGVSWSEALTIAPWILCIYLLLGVAGGTNPSPPGMALGLGLALLWRVPGSTRTPNMRATSGNSGPKITDASTRRACSAT